MKELWVDNVLVDLPVNGIGIAIRKSLVNYENPTERGGDTSSRVTLPLTATNKQVFGDYLEPNRMLKFRRTVRQPAKYCVNGLVVLEGTVQVLGASSEGIEIEIYSVTVSWIDHLSRYSLRTLQLPDIGFIGYTSQYAPIEPLDALTQPDIWLLDAFTSDIQFALVAYGNYPRNSTETGERAWSIRDIDWQSVIPQTYIRSAVIQMFAEAGLKVVGSWIDSYDLATRIMPYVGETEVPWNWGFLARARAEYNAGYSYFMTALGGGNQDIIDVPLLIQGWHLAMTTELYDYSQSYFISSPDQTYVVPVGGEYQFLAQVDITSLQKVIEDGSTLVADPLITALVIYREPDDADELQELYTDIHRYIVLGTPAVTNLDIIGFFDFGLNYADSPATGTTPDTSGTTYTQAWNGIPYGTAGAQINGSGFVSMSTSAAKLSRADRVKVGIFSAYAGAAYLTQMGVNTASGVFVAVESSHPERLSPASCMPDITRLDLFSSLVREFNLMFDVVGDSILIETRDNYYLPVITADDYTELCDIRSAVVKPIPYAATSRFEFADDSGDAILQRHGKSFADLEVVTDNIYSTARENKVDSVFAPTYDRVFNSRGNPGDYNQIVIPCMGSSEILETEQDAIEWQYNYQSRVLRYIGPTAGDWNYMGTVLTEYPAARFSYDPVQGMALTFDDGNGTLHVRGSLRSAETPSTGQYSRYWRQLDSDRQNGHLIELDVRMDATRFAQLSQRTPVRIEGNIYYLYSVEPFDPAADTAVRMQFVRW